MVEVTIYKYFVSYAYEDKTVDNDFITTTKKVIDLPDLKHLEDEIERKNNKPVKVINFKLLNVIYANEEKEFGAISRRN